MERGCVCIVDQTKLIEDNMKLVYFTVNKYYPRHIADEDVIQVGMIGLINAAQMYDESKGAFSTYACKCIRNEINKEFMARKKQIPTLSLDYEYRGGEDSESFTLIDTLLGDTDVTYVDLDSVSAQLNSMGKKVLDLSLAGLSSKEISKELGITIRQVNFYSRQIRLLLGR